jgi:hypothetical protein
VNKHSIIKASIALLPAILLYTPSFSSSVYTKEAELRPIRLSDTDLQREVNKLSNLIKSANAAGTTKDYQENVTFESGKSKVEISGHQFLSSGVEIPKASYKFWYYFSINGEAPIKGVSIYFTDYSRVIKVTGYSSEQVDAIFSTMESAFTEYSTLLAGSTIRLAGSFILGYIFIGGTILGSFLCFKKKSLRYLGLPIFSIIGIILMVTLPFEDILAGFAVYRGEASFIVRYGYQISFVSFLITLLGILFSYLSTTNIFQRTQKAGNSR